MKNAAMALALLAALTCAAGAQQGPDDEQPEGPPPAGGPMQPGRPPMGPERMGMERHHRVPELTDAQEQELMGFIKSNEPDMYQHLSTAKERMPAVYRQKLGELWRMYQDPEVRAQFLRQTKANRAVRDLVQQYRSAAPDGQAAVKEKLTAAVGDLFDADVAAKELQVKKMQAEIASLKDKIAKRRQLKDKFVAERVERMTGGGDDWEW